MEKRVNKILNNESAREILKAHALTAINSQVRRRETPNSDYKINPSLSGQQEEAGPLQPGEPGQPGHGA